MLREMDPELFFMWKAYYLGNPWGEKRADARIGILTALVANVNRDSKKVPKPFKAEDFFPILSDKSRSRGARRPMMADEWNAAKKQFKSYYGG